ncbi:MAG: L,D-transpeptidase [Legionellaceae bacterium]|nr:L,D-transpeptidase [Legionellaceae bacterium]MBP9774901.1 L,D-transpeptidase [Legionellaceae bacterium]
MKRVDWYKPLSFVACLASALLLWVSTDAQSIIPGSSYDVAAAGKFVFDPTTQRWTAINSDGQVVKSGHGSAGRAYCSDTGRRCRTPTGTFHVIQKRGADCRSSRYPVGKGGSPMPYCMFFSQYYAVHGSHEVPNYNASHGCIRIHPADAKWLYYNFMEVGTPVIVKPY